MSELIVLHGCATVQLTKGQNALVDAGDYPEMRSHEWCASKCGSHFYAVRHIWHGRGKSPQQTRIYMHRQIAGSPGRPAVDHQNRDTLDNRRENLRPATTSQNRANSRKKLWRGAMSSAFKGVSFNKKRRKWRAVIVKDRKQRELGFYADEMDAARAYNIAAIELHGEFARINEGV